MSRTMAKPHFRTVVPSHVDDQATLLNSAQFLTLSCCPVPSPIAQRTASIGLSVKQSCAAVPLGAAHSELPAHRQLVDRTRGQTEVAPLRSVPPPLDCCRMFSLKLPSQVKAGAAETLHSEKKARGELVEIVDPTAHLAWKRNKGGPVWGAKGAGTDAQQANPAPVADPSPA